MAAQLATDLTYEHCSRELLAGRLEVISASDEVRMQLILAQDFLSLYQSDDILAPGPTFTLSFSNLSAPSFSVANVKFANLGLRLKVDKLTEDYTKTFSVEDIFSVSEDIATRRLSDLENAIVTVSPDVKIDEVETDLTGVLT